MSNDLTQMDTQQVANFFEQYAEEEVGGSNIIGQLLRFTKYGEFKAGQDQAELEIGTRLLVFMPSLTIGWIKWSDNRPVQRLMGLVMDGFKAVKREELGDLDKTMWDTFEDGREKDPWQETRQVIMLDPETEELYTFVTSSVGGRGALQELARAFVTRMRMQPGEIPIIDLSTRSYKHSQYGEIRNPVFKITGWTKVPKTLADLDQITSDSNGSTPPTKAIKTKALPPAGKKVTRSSVRF